jgi:hypothetical protein
VDQRYSPGGLTEAKSISVNRHIRDREIEKTEVLDNGNQKTPKPKISVRERSGMCRSHDRGKGRTCGFLNQFWPNCYSIF